MAARRQRRSPATTVEGLENQLISTAITLAQKQLEDGTASAQVITHYLKLGSTREKLEQDRLRAENDMLRQKIENMRSAAEVEELYKNALDAMRSYSGHDVETVDDYDDH